MEKGRKKIHYAWFILAGCCIMQGASLGLINNCSGVFYSPVCQDLGFEMGKFTFYRMLYSISSALVLPFVAKSFQKLDVRAVISAAAVVFGVSNMAMGTFTELWQWYAAGMIQGIASSFLCMIAAPILLNNWFHKKAGMAVGISAAFSGLMGMMGSSALPYFFSAVKMAVPMSIIGAAIGEWLGAKSGLGYFSRRMMTQLDGAGVFAPIVLLSAAAILAVAVVNLLEKRFVRWRGES